MSRRGATTRLTSTSTAESTPPRHHALGYRGVWARGGADDPPHEISRPAVLLREHDERMRTLPTRKVLAMPQMTRRRLLQSSGALAVTALVGASRRATAAPVAKVESATVIS